VRRVPGHLGTQFAAWRYHAFVTNLAGPPGTSASNTGPMPWSNCPPAPQAGGLAHLPSGSFNPDSAWLQHAGLPRTYPVDRRLGGHTTNRLTVAKTFRTRLLAIPGRLVNLSGRPTLRLPARWSWADEFHAALDALRALPPAPG
jgi:hypothetical protein